MHFLVCHLFSAPLTQPQASLGSGGGAGTGEGAQAEARGVDQLDHAAERDSLLHTLREANKRVAFFSEHAEVGTFRRVVGGLPRQPRLLHFTGHGVYGSLALEDGQGRLVFASRSAILEMASGGGAAQLVLVFLSSCFSESVADAFVSAGVPHVVAVSRSTQIPDKKAQEFAHSFYAALLRGDTVRQAFALARDRLDVAGGGDGYSGYGAKFRLLPEDGDHLERPLAGLPDGAHENVSRPVAPSSCDGVAEHFLGRAAAVQRLFALMVGGRRRVAVVGERGIGKTQICLAACEYERARGVFGETFFCRLDAAAGGDARYFLRAGLGMTEPLPSGAAAAAAAMAAWFERRAAAAAAVLTAANSERNALLGVAGEGEADYDCNSGSSGGSSGGGGASAMAEQESQFSYDVWSGADEAVGGSSGMAGESGRSASALVVEAAGVREMALRLLLVLDGASPSILLGNERCSLEDFVLSLLDRCPYLSVLRTSTVTADAASAATAAAAAAVAARSGSRASHPSSFGLSNAGAAPPSAVAAAAAAAVMATAAAARAAAMAADTEEAVVPLEPLDAYSTAELFWRSSPRLLKMNEIVGVRGAAEAAAAAAAAAASPRSPGSPPASPAGASAAASVAETAAAAAAVAAGIGWPMAVGPVADDDPILSFSHSDIVRALRGHPGAAVAAATWLSASCNLLELEEYLLQEAIPAALAAFGGGKSDGGGYFPEAPALPEAPPPLQQQQPWPGLSLPPQLEPARAPASLPTPLQPTTAPAKAFSAPPRSISTPAPLRAPSLLPPRLLPQRPRSSRTLGLGQRTMTASLSRQAAKPFGFGCGGGDAGSELAALWNDVATATRHGLTGPAEGLPADGATLAWSSLADGISLLFLESVPAAAAATAGRGGLTDGDLDRFGAAAVLWKGTVPPAQSPGQLVRREQLAAFWRWFHPTLAALRATDWWERGLVVGFRLLSDGEARAALKFSRPGTFVIRFGTSMLSTLVITYVKARPGGGGDDGDWDGGGGGGGGGGGRTMSNVGPSAMASVPVHILAAISGGGPSGGGGGGGSSGGGGSGSSGVSLRCTIAGTRCLYPSLDTLVLAIADLQFLWPDEASKADVFRL